MNIYVFLACWLFVYMISWFVVSVVKKRNDVADIAWGLGFPLVCWLAFLFSKFSPLALLVNILVTVWGLRLAIHIYLRNKDKPEDSRYAGWRRKWKNFYLRSFLQVFMFQGVLLFLIVCPAVFINIAHFTDFNYLHFLGILIWVLGFCFEVASDWQLKKFIKDPVNKGKLMQSGLWKYSRHPNYFGEVTLWWGIFIIAIGLPGGAYTVFGPLTITFLILFVSGIPLLEKKYADRPDFEKYKRKTSILIPLPPKR